MIALAFAQVHRTSGPELAGLMIRLSGFELQPPSLSVWEPNTCPGYAVAPFITYMSGQRSASMDRAAVYKTAAHLTAPELALPLAHQFAVAVDL